MRLKKKYPCGQPRGGVKGVCVDSQRDTKKNYHQQEVAFHGGEMNFERWANEGKKGYTRG